MVATAFVGNIVIAYRNGRRESLAATMSDVTAEEWVAQDGGDLFRINASMGAARIADIILSAAGVDTRTSTIRVNGKLLPEVVLHGANVGTVVGRQFQQTPLTLPIGATIEFTQIT